MEENKLIPSDDWRGKKPPQTLPANKDNPLAPVPIQNSNMTQYHFYLCVSFNGKVRQLAMTPQQLAMFDILIKMFRNSAGGFDFMFAKDLPDNLFDNSGLKKDI